MGFVELGDDAEKVGFGRDGLLLTPGEYRYAA